MTLLSRLLVAALALNCHVCLSRAKKCAKRNVARFACAAVPSRPCADDAYRLCSVDCISHFPPVAQRPRRRPDASAAFFGCDRADDMMWRRFVPREAHATVLDSTCKA